MEVIKIYIGRKVKILSIRVNSNHEVYEIGKIVKQGGKSATDYFQVEVNGKEAEWYYKYDLELLEEEKNMEIIKFNPTSYEYRDGIHYINFDQEKLVWMTDDPGSLTWGNRSVIKIQMNNEGEIINRNHSYYFQLVDGTKRIFRLDDLIRNGDLENRLIKYLVDSEDEYLFNVMKDGVREVLVSDNEPLDKLKDAYKSIESEFIEKDKEVNMKKESKLTKVKEGELDGLIFEIEELNLERAIDRALDEKDKETFMKLTGGIQ